MKYTLIPPCNELKGLISHFWVGTWDITQQANRTYYVIANSLTELVFAFDGNHKSQNLLFSTVQGHTHVPNQFSVNGFYHLLGVSFHSYAIPLLFNMPATELNKAFISLETFLGREGTVLNEKIASASSTQERITLLSQYFISALKKQQFGDDLIINAIKEIKEFGGNLNIQKLANDFCLSQKQFGRRFKAFSGFSPKRYARIVRFESVIRNHSKPSNFTEVAYSQGYYDQAHFIHEFKSFTGFSPKDFWKINTDSK